MRGKSFDMADEIKVGLADMHNHILFGVDDGAKKVDDSVRMLDIAHKEGIRTLILTPHYHPKRGMAEYNEILENFELLKKVARQKFPEMQLFLGREVYYRSDITEAEEIAEELRMCKTVCILIEFSTTVEASYVKSAVSNLLMNGYQPIVAHVERYACSIKNKNLVADLKDMGAYIQINADSVIGDGGFAVKMAIKRFLKQGLVDFIATDAHDSINRRPLLSQCYKYIAKKYGEDYAHEIMCENPLKIIRDEL